MKLFIKRVPTLAVILVVYNMMAAAQFVTSKASSLNWIDVSVHTILLPSGTTMELTIGTVFLVWAVFCLYIEIFKSTDASDSTIFEHTLSFFVFLAYLVEFMFLPYAANATFLILCLMAALDLLAGMVITITAARRDLALRR
jgi:hypothetical protein